MKIEIYKLANSLKSRMGARFLKHESGFLAEESIKEADDLITELCATCPDVINSNLEQLAAIWGRMRDTPVSPERNEDSQKIFTLAHEIKDMGAMCGYELIAYFAESLRDYIGRTDLNLKAQIIIIQAHVDAMQIVHKNGVRNNAGPQAEELKKMVKMAIEKYQ